ncbi:ETX/MTX2 family pore-forming toxin [Thalassospira lucentensis]|uniref:ETX/MTX2 family pore-forming toxin n=1 Tax=Thalassospira lucentensis TaxID=168935 RepID=UPI003D2EAB12
MSQSLQNITDAWGRWKAKQCNTGMDFTASTNYGPHGQLNKYYKYQVQVGESKVYYNNASTCVTPGVPQISHASFANNTDSEQVTTFTRSVSSEMTMLWSVTEAEDLGVSVTITVGKPGFVQGSATVNKSFSLSETTSESSTIVQSWKVDQPIVCKPHQTVDATFTLSTDTYSTPFTTSTPLSGYVAVWFSDRVKLSPNSGDHFLYFIPIQTVFNECKSNGIIDTSGYDVGSSNVLAHAYGNFSGGEGLDYFISVKETPISEVPQVKEYIVDKWGKDSPESDYGRLTAV